MKGNYLMTWVPLIERKPVIGYIHDGVYGYETLDVRLADGRTATAEYSYHRGHYFWMVTIDPDTELGTYLWDEGMNPDEFLDRIAVVAWKEE
jgi:hypothetical protein